MTTNPETAGVEPVANEYETLIAAGIDDYAARCALMTGDDGGFCHAYFYSDGQWRFQTGGSDLHHEDGAVLRCLLPKRLYAHPPAAPDWNEAAATLIDGLPGDAFVLTRSEGLWTMRTLAAWQHLNPPAAREDGEEVLHALGQMLWPDTRTTPEDVRTYAVRVYRAAITRPAADQAPDHANCAMGEGKAITTEQLGEIMQEEWGEICEDTQAHPLDMRREGRKLFYDPHHWTAAIADRLNQWIPMPTPAAIRAETTAQIVAWLREEGADFAQIGFEQNRVILDHAADAIERGDHLTGGGE